MIKLYVRFDCPYCQKVIDKIEELTLEKDKDYELIEAGNGTPGREIVLKIGGKGQVPFMMDNKVHMYEGDDIINYIEKKNSKK